MRTRSLVVGLIVLLALTGCTRIQWLPSSEGTASPRAATAPPRRAVADPLAAIPEPSPSGGKVDKAVVQALLTGSGYVDEGVAGMVFQYQVTYLLERQAWDELQELFDDFETARPSYACDPTYARTFFDNGLAPGLGTLDDVKEWNKARPHSILASLALAQAHIHQMGTAKNPLGEAEEANAAIGEAFRKLRSQRPPPPQALVLDVYDTTMPHSAFYIQSSLKTIDENFAGALRAANGLNLSPYTYRAELWCPRWQGQQAGPLVAEATKIADSQKSDVLFAYMLAMGTNIFTDGFVGTDDKHWPRLRGGLVKILQNTGGDRHWANVLARYALAAQDMATAAPLMDALGDSFEPSLWDYSTFARSRVLAHQGVARGTSYQPPPLAPEVRPEGAEMRFDPGPKELRYRSFQLGVEELENQWRFLDLEAVAAGLRQGNGSPFGLNDFYDTVDFGHEDTDDTCRNRLEVQNAWLAAVPQSTAARLALARTWIDYGWVARGSGYANTVSDKAWDLLRERCTKAQELLHQAESLGCKDEALYEEQLSVGMGLSWSTAQLQDAFNRALQHESPGSWAAWDKMVFVLLPRWMGSYEDLQALAVRSGGPRAGPWHGKALLPVLATTLMRVPEDWKALKGRGAYNWPDLKKGVMDLLAQTQGFTHDEALGMGAALAVEFNDSALAHKLRQEATNGTLGTYFVDTDAWSRYLRDPLPTPHLSMELIGFGAVDPKKGWIGPATCHTPQFGAFYLLQHRSATSPILTRDFLTGPGLHLTGTPLTINPLDPGRLLSTWQLPAGRQTWPSGRYRMWQVADGQTLATKEFTLR